MASLPFYRRLLRWREKPSQLSSARFDRRKLTWRTAVLVLITAVFVNVALLGLIEWRRQPPRSGVLPPLADLHELRDVVRSNPRDADARLLLGKAYLRLGHNLSAREELDEALRVGADEWQARTARIAANKALLRYDLAAEDIERLMALRPRRPDGHLAYLALAEARQLGGDLKGARAALARVPREPDGLPQGESLEKRVVAAEHLAGSYGQLGDWQETLKIARLCSKLLPSRRSAVVVQGKALYELGRRAEAVPYLEPGIKDAPDNPEIHFVLGMSLLARNKPGDAGRAYRHLERTVALNDQHGRALYALAQAQERLGKSKAAAATYYRAHEMGTEGSVPLLRSGNLLLKIGLKEEGWYRRGLYYEKEGLPEKALAEYKQLTTVHSSCRSGFIHMARAYSHMKQPALALKYIGKAQRIEPARAGDLDWPRIQTLGEARRDAEREAAIRKLAAAGGKDVDAAYYQLAEIENKHGNLDQAEQWYRKCIEVKPDDAVYHLELGSLLLERRDGAEASPRLDQAIKSLQRAAALSPTDPRPFRDLGLAYSYNGRMDDAILALRHAVDLLPESGEQYQTLAQVLNKAGKRQEARDMLATFKRFQDFDQARQILTARAKREPRSAEAHRRLGDFHMMCKEYYSAIASYEKTLQLDPRDDRSRRSLAEAFGYVGRREDQKAQLARLGGARESLP